MSERPEAGRVGWIDLTVDDATRIRDFYGQVAGWGFEPVDMGGYEDFVMTAPDSGAPVAGVCHARGSNAGLPANWLIYVVVEDLEASVDACVRLGGKVAAAPRSMAGQGRYCVILDPAGAPCALFQPAAK